MTDSIKTPVEPRRSCADPEGGVRGRGLDPPENNKNIGFHSNTRPVS